MSKTKDEGPRFPKARVQLSGRDGNSFSIIARVQAALKKAGATEAEIKEFCDDAMSGDYDHVLQTCMAWADVS